MLDTYSVVELRDDDAIVCRRLPQHEAWCPALSVQQVALSSLETFRFSAIGPGDLQGTVYGIASVFTEAENRGHGYATILCREIQETLKREDPNVLAVILYSDVGPHLYSRAGFQLANVYPASRHLLLHYQQESQLQVAKSASRVQWLGRADVGPIVDEMCNEIRLQSNRSKEFIILPSGGQVDWLLEREYAVFEELGIPRLKYSGAKCGSSLVVWTAEMSKEKKFLKILLFQSGIEEENAVSSLAAAVLTALQSGLDCSETVMWSSQSKFDSWQVTDAALMCAGIRCEEKERKGSLPMLASLNPQVKASMWKFIPQALWV